MNNVIKKFKENIAKENFQKLNGIVFKDRKVLGVHLPLDVDKIARQGQGMQSNAKHWKIIGVQIF